MVNLRSATSFITASPSHRPAGDNPALPNLTWTYNNAEALGNPALTTDEVFLGTYSIRSIFDGPGVITAQAGQGLKDNGNELVDNVTGVRTPSVPEPTTLLLLGFGLASVAGLGASGTRKK